MTSHELARKLLELPDLTVFRKTEEDILEVGDVYQDKLARPHSMHVWQLHPHLSETKLKGYEEIQGIIIEA